MGGAASPATLLVLACWIASPDPVRNFILSPFAFILGLGAASPVLPFAFLGAFLAARGFPGWETSFWIMAAMVGARSAAMSFNRLVDREDDRLNPRTRNRALPQGLLSTRFVALFILASSLLFLASAWMLNDLAFQLFRFPANGASRRHFGCPPCLM